MKASIFYFSGTGNSLFVAKSISTFIHSTILYSIPSILLKNNKIEVDADIVGFIFPVYSQTFPDSVKDVLKLLSFTRKPYLFSIATNNGGPGRANFNFERLLKKYNLVLNAGFSLLMPGNSIIINDYTNDSEERSRRLSMVENSLKEMITSISKKENSSIQGDKSLTTFVRGKITTLARKIYNVPKHFHTDNSCNKCKSCIKICPQQNIALQENIVWGNKCTNCLACIHWCPKNAIYLDKKENRKQYHNPNINIKELFIS